MHQRVTRTSRSLWLGVTGLAVLACAGWVPFMGRTLSPDEGGMLMVAGQWGPGSSLYGDYWVDRPPLLVTLFAVADALGGPWALRTMGVLAVVSSVLLAGAVGRAAAPTSRTAPLLTAGAAAVLLATPLFGSGAVNGELLGMPFLLGGTLAALLSCAAPTWRRGFAWGVVAGVAGASAALVKQNLADVLVLVAALTVLRIARPGRTFAAAALGALLTVGAAVGLAATRGTHPAGLWEAVVAFRGQATATIVSSATESTTRRLVGLVAALLASMAPLLLVALARVVRRPAEPHTPIDLRWPAAAVLAWELVAVYLGGSYWLHYLLGLVPGVVLLTAAAAQRHGRPDRFVTWAFRLSAVSAACALAFVVAHPPHRVAEPVVEFLDGRIQPGDTGLVAFGAPNILQATGLQSPYPDLWSLPVRVRDPDLEHLSDVLAGPERPTWLIVAGRSIATWGVDATEAQRWVDAHYELVGEPGRFTVYHRKDLAP